MATRKIRRSSGNIFHDLGFPRAESESLRIRAELMVCLARILDQRDLTQAEAARAFGVTQPRISDLVRGKIELFSIDALVDMLGKAGRRVVLTTRSQRRVA